MIMIELLSVNFVTIGFTLIAITLIILTIDSFKIPVIIGIILSVTVRFSYLILWKVTKSFPYVWLTFTIIINQVNNKQWSNIDNIFSNIIPPEAISGNSASTIFDHLPQFLIVSNVFSMIILYSFSLLTVMK